MEVINILIIGIILFWIILFLLNRSSLLKRYNMTSHGPLLMIRTKRGLNLLSYLARSKRFWRVFSYIGIPLVLISMVSMLILILFQDYLLLVKTPSTGGVSPSSMLVIPGINPFIPIVWGLIGLIVAVVFHEFSHAILCKVENISVKSLGLILLLVPIGAFAEPDEGELRASDTREKLKVYSAGVISNLALAFIAFALLFGPVLGSISPPTGVPIVDVSDDHPAKEAGMNGGMIITRMNGKEIKTIQDFSDFMSKTKPGQVIKLSVHSGKSFSVKLAEDPDNPSKGFLGVYVFPAKSSIETLRSIPSSLFSPKGWLALYSLPFIGFNSISTQFYEPVWLVYLANLLLWIGWINFILGTFNCLPAVPLDGGHIFKELFKAPMRRLSYNKIEEVSSLATNSLTALVFVSIGLAVFYLLLY